MPKTIHAILIGINAYPSKPLYGCVNDALAVGEFFHQYCSAPDRHLRWNPRYLLAPHASDDKEQQKARQVDPKVADAKSPTRQNLIDAFQHFQAAEVQPDDICLVYYSGHGSLEPAAPEFSSLEPDGMNETYVCIDSRERDGRDLLDKEMAWLLYQTRARIPQGHLLFITDSCFSGGASKSSDDTTRDRREPGTDTPTPFSKLLGVANVAEADRILQLNANRLAKYAKEARHIQLSASRDNETSKETYIEGKQHGVFTWSLLRVLNAGGGALNYLELMRRVEALTRTMSSNQIPQLNVFAGAERGEAFLGGAVAAYRPAYPVLYQNNQWVMKAGALHGIVLDPAGKTPSTMLLSDGRNVNVKNVYANFSVLDASVFKQTEAATPPEGLLASVASMPNARISIFLKKDAFKAAQLKTLNIAIEAAQPQYCDFSAGSAESADYYVLPDDAGAYMLVRKGSSYPVFKRQEQARQFVDFCDQVGRWNFVQAMGKSTMEGFSREDLIIDLEILNDVTPDNIQNKTGLAPDGEVVLLYTPPDAGGEGEKVPALRCSVRLKEKSGFWVGGLYLDNEFGIHSFLEARQDKKGEQHVFEYRSEGVTFNAIPATIDPIRLKQGFREITEYLKIYISNKDFSLGGFEQPPLPLDDKGIDKGVGFGKGFFSTPDWMVVSIPITIRAKTATTDLKALSGVGFSVSGLPEGFSARAAVASTAEIAAKKEKSRSRSGEMETQQDYLRYIFPPAGLWGVNAEEPIVFSGSFDGGQQQSVSVLELTEVTGKLTESFHLNLEQHCAEDEVIVAFGYDADAEGYFPVGLSNGDAKVEMLALPSPTPGRIQGEEDGFVGKDLGASVKMFFKKLVHKKNPSTLALVGKDMSRTSDPEKIRPVLASAKNILMVTHGFLGDTDKIVAAMIQKTKVHESYDAILAYDFENLKTPLQDSAQDLLRRLRDVGAVDPAKGRRLTVLGSSMGGLVCRWMVEKEPGGNECVRKLFLVATPNLGTDIAPFRRRLFGLIGKALSGVSLFQPYLTPLAILGKKADKALGLWTTLEQMDPDKSQFLKDLNKNAVLPAEIQHGSICGTVKNMKNNKGNFWKRLKKFVLKTFMDWFVFEGEHDLINPLKSQKGAPWFQPGDIVVLPVDHLSYYFEEESLKEFDKRLKVYDGA